MISNIFSNVKISNKSFKLINNSIHHVSEIIRSVSIDYDIDKMDYEEVIKSIKEFALVDNRGIELFSKYEKKNFKNIVVKAFNINPNLNGYGVIGSAKLEELELGLKVLKILFKDATVKFAIDGSDKNNTNSFSKLEQVIKVNNTLDLYDEKLGAKAFGTEINKEDILIEDLLTLIYIGKSFKDGALSNEIYLTVYGGAVEGNKIVSVDAGASFNDVFNSLDGNVDLLKKVVVNGSINGQSKYSVDEKINHSMRGLLFLTEKDSPTQNETSCIRCSKCLRACPEGLNPIKLKELWNRKETDEFLKFGGKKCIECGLCSYVCPSNIEISQDIKTGKVFSK